MGTPRLPRDFKEFLKLLAEHKVEYLLVGGYAVGYYGYVRATADMDIWVRSDHANADKLVTALKAFGFDISGLSSELFLERSRIVRMGLPPFRIELMSSVSGVEFDDCYQCRSTVQIDGVDVSIISLEHLRENKQAAGRHKDLDDLENLP